MLNLLYVKLTYFGGRSGEPVLDPTSNWSELMNGTAVNWTSLVSAAEWRTTRLCGAHFSARQDKTTSACDAATAAAATDSHVRKVDISHRH